jgi:hypothetical protein
MFGSQGGVPVTHLRKAMLDVVFTVPHELGPLALQNKRLLYDLLFRTSAETLLEVARDPQHRYRFLQRAAYLEPEAGSPASPLRGSGRRSGARPQQMDLLAAALLSACGRAEEGLSRQTHEALKNAFQRGRLGFHKPTTICRIHGAYPEGLPGRFRRIALVFNILRGFHPDCQLGCR